MNHNYRYAVDLDIMVYCNGRYLSYIYELIVSYGGIYAIDDDHLIAIF